MNLIERSLYDCNLCNSLVYDWLVCGLALSGACSASHRCAAFCYGFRVERHVSWKRCATGFEIVFSCLVGVSEMSEPISSDVYVNHAVLKRQLAQCVQK